MRLLASTFLIAIAAGCASDPKAEAAKDREKSREEIRQVTEEIIAAMRENRPEAYHERLCRAHLRLNHHFLHAAVAQQVADRQFDPGQVVAGRKCPCVGVPQHRIER